MSPLRQWIEYFCYTVWISAKLYNTHKGIETSIMKCVKVRLRVVGHFCPCCRIKVAYMLDLCEWHCYRFWKSPECTNESSLTYIPAVNGYKHIDDPLKSQQPDTQNHQSLQAHTSPGPHVWHQQTHFPPEALPCWPRDHLLLASSLMLLREP